MRIRGRLYGLRPRAWRCVVSALFLRMVGIKRPYCWWQSSYLHGRNWWLWRSASVERKTTGSMSTLKSNDSRVEKQSPQRALPARTGGLLRTFALDRSHDISVEAYTFYKKKIVCLFVCLFVLYSPSLPPPLRSESPGEGCRVWPRFLLFRGPRERYSPLAVA